jgi:hypothetical protein
MIGDVECHGRMVSAQPRNGWLFSDMVLDLRQTGVCC